MRYSLLPPDAVLVWKTQIDLLLSLILQQNCGKWPFCTLLNWCASTCLSYVSIHTFSVVGGVYVYICSIINIIINSIQLKPIRLALNTFRKIKSFCTFLDWHFNYNFFFSIRYEFPISIQINNIFPLFVHDVCFAYIEISSKNSCFYPAYALRHVLLESILSILHSNSTVNHKNSQQRLHKSVLIP